MSRNERVLVQVVAFVLLAVVVAAASFAIGDKIAAIATVLTTAAVFVGVVSYASNPDWDELQADVHALREAAETTITRPRPAPERQPRLPRGIMVVVALAAVAYVASRPKR